MLSMMLAVSMVSGKVAYKLVFSQDFDGAAGTAPDAKVWARDIGGGGYGNNEWQSYTDGAKNAFLDGHGHLVIEARKEKTTGPDGIARDYSSARLKTQGKFSFTFGKAEARIKMPVGKGIWPAFWTLGDNLTTVGWPKCGEIDIMEYLGHEPSIAHGTIHGEGFSGDAGKSTKVTLPEGQRFDTDFHVFAIEWSPTEIRWLLDGKEYARQSAETVAPSAWPFTKPQFLLLNLAVGGNWPGYPDDTTHFPQRMLVDYVRVYQKE